MRNSIICILSLLTIGCGNASNENKLTTSEVDSMYSLYLETATFNYNIGNDSLAILYYDSAIELKASHGVINDRAGVKYRAGDFEGALQDFDLAIKMGGEMYHLNRAYVLMELGHEEEALRILDEDFQKRKDTSGYLFDKSYFMLIKKDLRKFEELMGELIAKYPNSKLSEMARYNHIELLLKLKDTTRACQILNDHTSKYNYKKDFENIDCSKEGIGN